MEAGILAVISDVPFTEPFISPPEKAVFKRDEKADILETKDNTEFECYSRFLLVETIGDTVLEVF